MIKPHGSDELNPLFVYDTDKHEALSKEAETLPSLQLSSSAAGNAVMLGAGYYNPLTGFMNVADLLLAPIRWSPQMVSSFLCLYLT